ncbi:MAG: LEPR-XLL domain-containing protein [Burkholderiales bacterium]|nr:LEPR-XLL domain-containing protein [Burkholderiales bacterium]
MRRSSIKNDRPDRQKSFALTSMVSALKRAFNALDFSPRTATKISPDVTQSVVSTPVIRFEPLEPRVLLAADPVIAVADAITVAGETDHHNFTVESDIKVVFDSLTNNPNLNWSLDGPNGTVVTARGFSASDSTD